VIAPATSTVLTATVSALEHRDVGEYAESVTLYEYVEEAVGDADYDEDAAPNIANVQAPSEYHWYENDGVPPDA
jgi:hypothetical protein